MGRNGRHIIPDHFEAAFKVKPRARVMVYRDWLVALSSEVADYVSEICHKQRESMNEQMLGLYELAVDLGTAEFMAAVELAGEQHLFGTEYIRAIATRAGAGSKLDEAKGKALALPDGMGQQPAQFQVERQLADYERFVANAAQVFEVTSEVEVRTEIEVTL